MGQMQDEAGNIWEVDAQGNAVALVQSAQAAAPAPLTFGTPDPSIPRKEARADRDQQLQESAAARADRAEARAAQAAELDRQLKALQIEAAKVKTGQGGAGLKKVSQLVAQINRVQELYDANIGATKGVAGLKDYLPTNENARFDTAGAQLSQIGLAAFRTPGTGTVSDRDAIMFDKGNLPTAGTRDAAIEEILGGLRRRVEEEYEAAGQAPPTWGGQRADNEVPDPSTGAALAPGPNDNSPTPPEDGSGTPNMEVATGANRNVYDKKLSAQVDAMMNAGASKAMIDTVLKQQGFPAIDPSTYTAAKTWMKDNPNKKYFGAEVTKQEPTSFLSRAAASPFGSFMANGANSATAGILGALSGDEGRGNLDAMAAINPNASLVGNVAGGVVGAGALELAALRAFAPALARYAPRIADGTYGAISGANAADEGEGLQGALAGAGVGVAGGYLGQRAAQGVAAMTRGVQAPAARYLRDQGIPITVGQAVESTGSLGSGIKKLEDAATSIPFVGNMVDARRMEGLRGFNAAAFREAAAPGANITATGSQGVQQLRQGVGDAYSRALDPVTIDPTEPQFGADLMDTILRGESIPNVNGAQDAALAGLQHRVDGAIDPATGMMTGRGFQEAYRGMARTGRERAASDYGHEVGQVMRQGQDTLGEALERQNPGAFDGFVEANAANRRVSVLADALKNAGNATDELITPAQLNRADITSTGRLSGRIESAAGNRPFYDLATAGQAVLPSRLPDSGTATRGGLMMGLGAMGGLGAGGGAALGGGEGAATGGGLGLGAAIALALGGSRGAQNVATRVLMDRPDFAVPVANQIERGANLSGHGLGAYLGNLIAGP